MIENLDVFFSDFSSEVVWGTSIFKAILDSPDESITPEIISTEYMLTAKFSDLEGKAPFDNLTVDGQAYQCRSIRKMDDGRLAKAWIAKV